MSMHMFITMPKPVRWSMQMLTHMSMQSLIHTDRSIRLFGPISINLFMHMFVHILMHISIYLSVHMSIHRPVQAPMPTPAHKSVHMSIHTFAEPHSHTCLCTHRCTYQYTHLNRGCSIPQTYLQAALTSSTSCYTGPHTHACTDACTHAHMHARIQASKQARTPAPTHAPHTPAPTNAGPRLHSHWRATWLLAPQALVFLKQATAHSHLGQDCMLCMHARDHEHRLTECAYAPIRTCTNIVTHTKARARKCCRGSRFLQQDPSAE